MNVKDDYTGIPLADAVVDACLCNSGVGGPACDKHSSLDAVAKCGPKTLPSTIDVPDGRQKVAVSVGPTTAIITFSVPQSKSRTYQVCTRQWCAFLCCWRLTAMDVVGESAQATGRHFSAFSNLPDEERHVCAWPLGRANLVRRRTPRVASQPGHKSVVTNRSVY